MSVPRLFLPRIYLDTNVLVSAILESDKEWLKAHPQRIEKQQLIQTSEEIYNKWEPRHLKTSVFAVAEFISTGRTEHHGRKSYDEMFEIAGNKFLSKCQIININLNFEKLPKIDKRWEKHWQLLDFKGKGEAIQKGKSMGMMEIYYMLGINMQLIQGYGGSIPKDFNRKVFPKFKQIRSSSYKAPAFEILLFSRASEIANELNLHISDAIHIISAKGEAEYIITNDKKFYEKWENNPVLRRKAGIDVKSSTKFLKFCHRLRLI